MTPYHRLGDDLTEAATPPPEATAFWRPGPEGSWGPPPTPQPQTAPSARPPLEGIVPPGLRLTPDRPLVFLPGVMGTQLRLCREDGAQGSRAWPPVFQSIDTGEVQIDWSLDGFADLTRLAPDARRPLVPTIYERPLDFLEELGYVPGESLFVFGYNWTESHRVSARRLAGFVRDVLRRTGADAVDAIGHSAGGIVLRTAALHFGTPLRRVAYLASPHYGAPKAYFSAHPSISPDKHLTGVVPDLVQGFFANALSYDVARYREFLVGVGDRLRSCPALYELMPDRFYFERVPSFVQVGLLESDRVVGPEATYLDGASAFPTEEQRVRARGALELKASLGRELVGERVLVLYSGSQATADQVQSRTGRGFARPTAGSDANGDKTVPTLSAAGPDPEQAIEVVGTRHQALPRSRACLYWLGRFLADPV